MVRDARRVGNKKGRANPTFLSSLYPVPVHPWSKHMRIRLRERSWAHQHCRWLLSIELLCSEDDVAATQPTFGNDLLGVEHLQRTPFSINAQAF